MNISEALVIWDKSPVLSSSEAKSAFQELIASPFDPEVHYSIAYLYLHYAQMDEVEQLLENAPKDDETYLQLNDYLQAIKFVDTWNLGVFPLSVPYREWWHGSHPQLKQAQVGNRPCQTPKLIKRITKLLQLAKSSLKELQSVTDKQTYAYLLKLLRNDTEKRLEVIVESPVRGVPITEPVTSHTMCCLHAYFNAVNERIR